jgi:hypothetical protein
MRISICRSVSQYWVQQDAETCGNRLLSMFRARSSSIWSVKGRVDGIHSTEVVDQGLHKVVNIVAAMSWRGLAPRCRREKVVRQIWWTPIEAPRDVVFPHPVMTTHSIIPLSNGCLLQLLPCHCVFFERMGTLWKCCGISCVSSFKLPQWWRFKSSGHGTG